MTSIQNFYITSKHFLYFKLDLVKIYHMKLSKMDPEPKDILVDNFLSV